MRRKPTYHSFRTLSQPFGNSPMLTVIRLTIALAVVFTVVSNVRSALSTLLAGLVF